MIANCPACGTHYKHQVLAVPARARCGRCDATVDLSRLRPYRIVAAGGPSQEDAVRTVDHLPIGLDDPSLATTMARHVASAPRIAAAATRLPKEQEAAATPVAPATFELPPIALATADATWDTDDPLPSIPEMTATDRDILGSQRVADEDRAAPLPQQPEGRRTTFALWLIAGAIVGTGISWTLGGTTEWGIGAGAIAGSLTGWVWLRWTSPK